MHWKLYGAIFFKKVVDGFSWVFVGGGGVWAKCGKKKEGFIG